MHGTLRGVARGEGDERVAAVGPRHRVHHEPQVPDRAAPLEQRDQLVLEQGQTYITFCYLILIAPNNVTLHIWDMWDMTDTSSYN